MPRSTGTPNAYPISIKGVVFDPTGRVLLLRNERQEWELPGGRIEIGETPQECVVREIYEETQWKVTAGPIIDTWMYYIDSVEKHVFIVTYGCYLESDVTPVLSSEHKEIGRFTEYAVPALNMPEGYRRSISAWMTHSGRRQ